MRKKADNRLSSGGFTLIEVVVAALIVIIASSIMIGVFIGGANLTRESLDNKSDTQSLGYDIYTDSTFGTSVNVPLELSQNETSLSGITIPMNIKTYTGSESGKQMLVFRWDQ